MPWSVGLEACTRNMRTTPARSSAATRRHLDLPWPEDRAERRAEGIALSLPGRTRFGMQEVDDAFDRMARRKLAYFFAAFVGDGADRSFDEIAHHRFDVAPHVADLGILGGLHLDERCADQRGQAARDLGLADASGPDHEDVLRRNLVTQVFTRAGPPIPVAQCDRNGALRLALADDVFIELFDDLPRRQAGGVEIRRQHPGHGRLSTVMSLFV